MVRALLPLAGESIQISNRDIAWQDAGRPKKDNRVLHAFPPQALFWASLAFLVAFAVKVPVFPLHGWLGDVFSEAPTAMAMVVAGKLGLYSILRFNLGLFPAQARQVALQPCGSETR